MVVRARSVGVVAGVGKGKHARGEGDVGAYLPRQFQLGGRTDAHFCVLVCVYAEFGVVYGGIRAYLKVVGQRCYGYI